VVIAGLLAVIGLGFGYTLLRSGADPAGMATGLVPRFDGTDSVLQATGILGATVMPHVIYVHSALVPDRYGLPPELARHDIPATRRQRLLRTQRIDVIIAMGLAGVVNAVMLIIAAQLFFGSDTPVESLEEVHAGLGAQLGTAAAIAFGIALLASGLAASAVGTYAGQVIMAGFLKRRIPLLVRRLITVIPALALLASGADPTNALVWSQVVLSFGIPFALVPLVWFTSRKELMGAWVNRPLTTVIASVVAALIIGLNAFLLINLATG
jgi:manganese transport protein